MSQGVVDEMIAEMKEKKTLLQTRGEMAELTSCQNRVFGCGMILLAIVIGGLFFFTAPRMWILPVVAVIVFSIGVSLLWSAFSEWGIYNRIQGAFLAAKALKKED